MKEILINSISNVEYKIYVDGVLTDATGAVRVTIYKDETKVVDNQLATAVGSVHGTYKYLLPTSITVDAEDIPVTTSEGTLKVTWSFTLGSNNVSITEYYSVVFGNTSHLVLQTQLQHIKII
jgi:hypothetical protein